MPYLINTAICVAGLIAGGLSVLLLQMLHVNLQQRRFQRALLEQWEHRARARIVHIGDIIINVPNRSAVLVNWEMELGEAKPAERHPITCEMAVGGYTIPELLEIQRRRSEWEV